MPIYQLDEELWFPKPSEYEEHGIIAVGGDLSPERLLFAYQKGIFPWYNPEDPITWWCPFKRMVLKPEEVKISKSSRNLLNRGIYTFKFDQNFEEVIDQCQKIKRKGQPGTWLNNNLKESIIKLHNYGYAHSAECYREEKLIGGLYGISLGKYFFGESMFSTESNASKLAFIHLCKQLKAWNFELLDCQIHNDHLASLGAYEIDRELFLKQLDRMDITESKKGSWANPS